MMNASESKKQVFLLHAVLCCMIAALSLNQCTQQTTYKKKQTLQHSCAPFVKTGAKDTITYCIGFKSAQKQKYFTDYLDSCIGRFNFDTVLHDTIRKIVYLQLRPHKSETMTITPFQRPTIRVEQAPYENEISHSKPDNTILEQESAIQLPAQTSDPQPEAAPSINAELPKRQGFLSLFSERYTYDDVLDFFTDSIPISIGLQKNSESQEANNLLEIKQISQRKIQIQCSPSLKNTSGQPISSIELLQAWSDFIKARPSEGLALFGSVKGIRKFIKGEDATIQGFTMTSQSTILISLEADDTTAIYRLMNYKILPPTSRFSKFILTDTTSTSFAFVTNSFYSKEPFFLEGFKVISGDRNPFVSYSLNKFDILCLYEKADLEYAKRTLNTNSYMISLPDDCYFLSLTSSSKPIRSFIKSCVDPASILSLAIKSEGFLIHRLFNDDSTHFESTDSSTEALKPSRVQILYNSDDPISKQIADRLYTKLSTATISVLQIGLKGTAYELRLIDRNYDIAIGRITTKSRESISKQLRISTVYFNSMTDESARIAQEYEIPLFSIKRYAVCKNHVKFFNNKLSGIYKE